MADDVGGRNPHLVEIIAPVLFTPTTHARRAYTSRPALTGREALLALRADASKRRGERRSRPMRPADVVEMTDDRARAGRQLNGASYRRNFF